MSYCPVPTSVSKASPSDTVGTKTVNPPGPRDESCGASTSEVVTTGPGESTSTTVYVPVGNGTAGVDGKGFEWMGQWTISENYVAQSDTNPLASVVYNNGSSYVCIADNISNSSTAPEHEPGVDASSWSLLAMKAEGALSSEDQSFFDSLKDDVFDWIKNADASDLILAGLGAAGIIWAGSSIISSMLSTGSGDGNADSTYDGSDGYVLSNYTPPDIKDILTALCELEGITHDVSLLPDASCEFTIGNITSARSIITQLSIAYQFDIVDTQGILKFVPRTSIPVKTLSKTDLAFTSSSSPATLWTGDRLQGVSLPKTITLKYYDSNLDYNIFTQTAEFPLFDEGQDVVYEVPVTLDAFQAKKIALLTLVNTHLERTQYQFTSSYTNMDLEPGDVIDSPMGLLRITRITESEEGLLDFTATDAGGESAVESSANLTAVMPPATTNIPTAIGYSQGLFIDPQNLDDLDTTVRIYAIIHGYGAAGWPGAIVYMSDDNGATYYEKTRTTTESTFGLVASALPSADYHVIDNTNTITVTLKTGELASISDAEFLNGKNRCMVGQEIIWFKNATLVSEKTYVLDTLIRGRQGTEQFVSTHSANELFTLINEDLVKLSFDDSYRLQTRKFKVVTIGSSIDKVDAQDVKITSANTLRWPVLNPTIAKSGNDYVISYGKNLQFGNSLKDLSTANADDDFAGFAILVYTDSSYSAIKNKYTTTSTSFRYGADKQTADFGSVQSNAYVRIVQLSKKYGAGFPVTVHL